MTGQSAVEVRWSSTVTRTSEDGRAVFIKQYQEGDWGRSREAICSRTAREARVLERLCGAREFRGRLGTQKLVSHSVVDATLTTFEAPGKPLEEYLCGAYRRRFGTCCHKALFLAGRWLRQFQLLKPLSDDFTSVTRFDLPNLLEYCDCRAAVLQELGHTWPNSAQRQQLRYALEQLLDNSLEVDCRQVLTHGDYGPSNVLWDEQVLTPIDFSMIHVDYPLADVTYFIHRCEMLKVYFPWRRWPLQVWRAAFLRGYGRPDATASPLYRALMIRHWLCRLVSFVRQRPENMKQALHNAWICRYARHILGRHIDAAQMDQARGSSS